MSYEDPVSQGTMALDAHRNAYYERALRQAITSDSVVLDAGAGIGTLGLMAAKLGARHVYLVEPVTQVETIKQLTENNNLSHKVTLLPAKVESVSLPEQVDVITSVFTGNFLLEEDLLPSLFVARDRWLKPGGILLPGQGRMMVMPVGMADYYESQIGIWQRDMAGVRHDIMHSFAVNTMYHDRFNGVPHQSLGGAMELASLDFYTAGDAACDAEIELAIETNGVCHGFLGWFDMSFEGDWLSTGPGEHATHWSQVFLPLNSPMTLSEGDRLSLQVKRPEFGDWHWRVEFGDQVERHSTFLSRPVTTADIARRSPDFSPELNQKGMLLKQLFGLMDGERSSAEIAALLLEKFPEQLGSIGAAERFVTKKAAEFGFEDRDS